MDILAISFYRHVYLRILMDTTCSDRQSHGEQSKLAKYLHTHEIIVVPGE